MAQFITLTQPDTNELVNVNMDTVRYIYQYLYNDNMRSYLVFTGIDISDMAVKETMEQIIQLIDHKIYTTAETMEHVRVQVPHR